MNPDDYMTPCCLDPVATEDAGVWECASCGSRWPWQETRERAAQWRVLAGLEGPIEEDNTPVVEDYTPSQSQNAASSDGTVSQ